MITRRFLLSDDINKLVTQNRLELFFQDNVLLGLVGKDQLVITDLASSVQIAQNGNKWRYTCATSQEHALALVFDGAPGVADDQLIALAESSDLIGHALVIRINLGNELQIGIRAERGESERPFLIPPSFAINGYLGGLPGCEREALGLFKPNLSDVVGNLSNILNFQCMTHSSPYAFGVGRIPPSMPLPVWGSPLVVNGGQALAQAS